jgi:hypothetical protein
MITRCKFLKILGLALLLFMTGSAEAQHRSKMIPKKRDWFDISFIYNNLVGVGVGAHLKPVSLLSFDFIAGTESPIHIIWAMPYHGNIANFCVQANLNLPLGLRISGGWYAGYFDLTRDLPVESQVNLWQSAPTLSLSIKLPSLLKNTIWYFELGSAFNLPTRIQRTFNETFEIMAVEVERSMSNSGSAFPYYSIILLIE